MAETVDDLPPGGRLDQDICQAAQTTPAQAFEENSDLKNFNSGQNPTFRMVCTPSNQESTGKAKIYRAGIGDAKNPSGTILTSPDIKSAPEKVCVPAKPGPEDLDWLKHLAHKAVTNRRGPTQIDAATQIKMYELRDKFGLEAIAKYSGISLFVLAGRYMDVNKYQKWLNDGKPAATKPEIHDENKIHFYTPDSKNKNIDIKAKRLELEEENQKIMEENKDLNKYLNSCPQRYHLQARPVRTRTGKPPAPRPDAGLLKSIRALEKKYGFHELSNAHLNPFKGENDFEKECKRYNDFLCEKINFNKNLISEIDNAVEGNESIFPAPVDA